MESIHGTSRRYNQGTPSSYPTGLSNLEQKTPRPDADEFQEPLNTTNQEPLKRTLTVEELTPYYSPKKLSYFEEARFRFTLSFNKTMTSYYANEPSKWNPYDEVLEGVYLGRILEKEDNPIPKDVGLIVSVITYGELAAIKFPLKTFIENGGKHIFVHMEDFDSQVSANAVIEAMKSMHDFLNNPDTTENKKKIYVHCKAGAARSASLVAAYHAHVNNISLEESIQVLEGKRVQVDVGEKKRESFEKILILAKASQDEESVQPKQKLDMASLDAKNRLRHLPGFKRLALYAIIFDGTKRADYVKDFLQTLLFSQDSEWHSKLCSSGCLLNKFANATPIIDSNLGFEDKDYREKLVEQFRSEVESLANGF